MDIIESTEIIIPFENNGEFAVHINEADMLNFGFDFSDYDSNTSRSYSQTLSDGPDNDSIVTSSSSTASSSNLRGKKKEKKIAKVKKSAAPKKGSKIDRGELICSSSHDSMEEINPPKKWAPNLSRKFRDLKLYAFPSFDKCDSLLFFPQSMSRHLNSGDYRSLVQLMNTHLHRSCMVRITPDERFVLPPIMFVKMFEAMNDAHPDSVLCVHTTKVIENELKAKMYFKFTDSHVINKNLENIVKDEPLKPLLIQDRSERFKDNLNLAAKSEEEKQQLIQIVDSNVDLIVYGRIDLKLTFDTAKKIVGIDFLCEFTSLSTTEIGREMDEIVDLQEL